MDLTLAGRTHEDRAVLVQSRLKKRFQTRPDIVLRCKLDLGRDRASQRVPGYEGEGVVYREVSQFFERRLHLANGCSGNR